MKRTIERFKLLPKKCSRCGNDFMTGSMIIHLPYEKKYISLCRICVKGLELPETKISETYKSDKDWKKFWEQKIKV